MLSVEQVKPLLLHEDISVRNLATRYFRDVWSRDAELVPLILRACRQFGVKANNFQLNACRQLRISDGSLDELLRLLAEFDDKGTIWAIERVLIDAPGDVLRRRESQIRDARNLSIEALQVVEQRIDIASWSDSKAWQELESIDWRCTDEEANEDIDFAYVENLIGVLSLRREPSEVFICDRLRSLAGEGRWQESFLVDLAGERRIGPAVRLLLDCLLRDDEFLAERAVVALAKIGDSEVARLIRPAFGEQPWQFRSFAAEVLGNTKHPAAEQALLELLNTEEEPEIREILCKGLCDMFSEQGVEIVRREMLEGFDPMRVDLKERVLVVAQVLGIEFPEAGQWRAKLDEEARLQAKRAAEIEELERRYADLVARGIDPFAPKTRPLNLTPQVDATALKQLERPKVGRNEACPCGSGKKYKKCCGRRF